jgi:hypothetical protein
MKILNFFRSKPNSEETKKAVPSNDAFQLQLLNNRMEMFRPVISYGPVNFNPPLESNKFDFDTCMIGIVEGKYKSYILDGNNGAAFIRDIPYINRFAQEANNLIIGLPSFALGKMEIVFEPFFSFERGQWLWSRIQNEGVTPTGKPKKFPFSIIIDTYSGEKSGRFYYDSLCMLGKGHINVKNPDDSNGIFSYSIDFGNEKLLRIIANTQADGRQMLYNSSQK